jgi:nucleoside-diphosphate-sugar epimerase
MLQKVDWYPGDITNLASISEALDGVDNVYHCAAFVSFEQSKKSEIYEINVIGTRNIVNMCLEHETKKLLHVSSIATIGPGIDQKIQTEKNKWISNPKSIYSLTKILAEQEVWRGITEGLNAVIINPSIILGAGNNGQSSARIFEKIQKGMKFYTHGSNGFVDVNDVVKIMLLLMNSEIAGERFILNGINLSYRELFVKIANSLNVKPPVWNASPLITSIAWKAAYLTSFITSKSPVITRESARSAQKIQAYSSEKLMKLTGFSFTNIDDTIRDIASFYLKNNSSSNRQIRF